MPIGLIVPVIVVGWGTACALTSWRRLGGVARVPALLLNELPFLAGYLLIGSMFLALAQGEDAGLPGRRDGGPLNSFRYHVRGTVTARARGAARMLGCQRSVGVQGEDAVPIGSGRLVAGRRVGRRVDACACVGGARC